MTIYMQSNSASFLFLLPSILDYILFFSFCSFLLSTPPPPFSTNAVASLTLIFLPLSSLECVFLRLTASESVLLQQLFQPKLTRTGSLVPAARGRAGLRGPKAALLLHHRTPPAGAAASVPQQPRRYHDLTKVQHEDGELSVQ